MLGKVIRSGNEGYCERIEMKRKRRSSVPWKTKIFHDGGSADSCWRWSSSLIWSALYFLECSLEYLSKEKGGSMRIPASDLTWERDVNVSPCLSLVPISIVACSSVNPWYLWIVIAQAIVNESYLQLPHVIGIIRMNLGLSWSHVGPM